MCKFPAYSDKLRSWFKLKERSARDWKVRSTKVDAGDFKHELLNRLRSTIAVNVLIHFLARCSNFCKPLKKNSEICPSNQVSAAAMTSASDEKWRPFRVFLQSSEQVVVRRGPVPENKVGDQDIGSPGRPVSSGLQVAREPGALSYKNKTTLVSFTRRFSFKMSFNCTSRDK